MRASIQQGRSPPATRFRFHHALVEASGLPGVWNVVSRTRGMWCRERAICITASARPPCLNRAARARRLPVIARVIRAIRTGDIAVAKRRMAQHRARNFEPPRAIAARHPEYFVQGRAGRDSSAHGAWSMRTKLATPGAHYS
jgi:DNA-binding GntR family transcriptional regulator